MQTKGLKGISGCTLKMIAMAAMLIDHVAAAILMRIMIANGLEELNGAGETQMADWLAENGTIYLIYTVMRVIGRMAFPIYSYLIVQGFVHTRDWRNYAIRLAVFALVSEVPFDLVMTGKAWNPDAQNIFYTLLFGLVTIVICDRIEKKEQWKQWLRWLVEIAVVLCGVGAAAFLQTDYGAMGVLVIVVFYLFRRNQQKMLMFGGAAVLMADTWSVLGILPLALYNGQRGKQKKYLFYLFYPLHLLVLYLICCAMGIGGISAI